MRLNSKYPQNNAVRERTFFAWLPITIKDETRWLERVTVVERYNYYRHGDHYWYPEEFVNRSVSHG